MLLAVKLLGAGLPLVTFQHPNFVGSGNCALCHSLLTDAARNDVSIDTHSGSLCQCQCLRPVGWRLGPARNTRSR